MEFFDSSTYSLPPQQVKADPDPLPPEEGETGFWPVLSNRNFLTLWTGQLFSQVADKIYIVLMVAIIAAQYSHEDQPMSGLISGVMVALTVPAVLFGSVAGALVDRWSKKLVLVATNLARGLLVLSLPSLLWLTHDWGALGTIPWGFGMILGLSFLVSVLTQFFAPAEQAVIPLILERRHLLSANSLYTTTMLASVILGFALGEPLLALAERGLSHFTAHPEWGGELLVGGSYIVAGLLLLGLRTPQEMALAHPGDSHVWQDIQEGLQYLKQQPRVLGALIQLMVLFSVFASLSVLVVRLAQVIEEIKASQFGFLLAAGGVGMALGASVIGHLGAARLTAHHRLSLVGSLGVAVTMGGLAWFPYQLWIVLGLLTVMGVFTAMAVIPMQTTIQEETPETIRGKVFGLQNNAINIALSLPLALTGVAETYLGLKSVLWALAVLTLVGGSLTWYISLEKNPLITPPSS